MFSRINKDGSSFTADVHARRTWINLSYYSNKYNVTNIFGKMMFNTYSEENNRTNYTYEYNPKTNMGSCKKGNCPENFIREARQFYNDFKNEFKIFFEDQLKYTNLF